MSNSPYVGQKALPDTERSVAGPFTGLSQNLGTALAVNPIIMILDNQSTVSAAFYWNGTLWRTFPAGEALVLDFRTNRGEASTFCPSIGDQFALIATAGTGSFSLSIIYAG